MEQAAGKPGSKTSRKAESECASGIAELSPDQLAAAAYSIATALSRDFSAKETAVLSSFFFNIGSVLGLIARQRELIDDCREQACRNGSAPAGSAE